MSRKSKKTPKYAVVHDMLHRLRVGGPNKATTWCGFQVDMSRGDKLSVRPIDTGRRCPTCFGTAIPKPWRLPSKAASLCFGRCISAGKTTSQNRAGKLESRTSTMRRPSGPDQQKMSHQMSHVCTE